MMNKKKKKKISTKKRTTLVHTELNITEHDNQHTWLNFAINRTIE